MTDDGFEIICDGCRSPVPSTTATCPNCGRVLLAPAQPAPVEPLFPVRRPLPPARAPSTAGLPFDSSRSWELPASPRAYGGFWIRVGAYLIDTGVLLLPTIALELTLDTAGAVLSLIVVWLYFAVMESSESQATLGKHVCGLAVTDTHGRRISFGRASGRYLGKFLSSLILGIGYLMVAFTSRKQGLHDLIAGTLVIRK